MSHFLLSAVAVPTQCLSVSPLLAMTCAVGAGRETGSAPARVYERKYVLNANSFMEDILNIYRECLQVYRGHAKYFVNANNFTEDILNTLSTPTVSWRTY